MIKKRTLFDFLTHAMVVWGIAMLCLCLFCELFGESAKGYSTMFELGKEGIPVVTAVQFFGISIVITILRWLFFTDKVIKEISIVKRSILMFLSVIVLVGIFARVFGWFPVNQLLPWIMFIVSFSICAFFGVLVSAFKEKIENAELQKALERMKGEESHE